MGCRFYYSLAGSLFGLLIPLFLLFFRAYAAHRELWNRWLSKELMQFDAAYIVVSIFSISFFSLIGYFLGRSRDGATEESIRVKDSNITLSELAVTDGLTGLFNARAIHERLDIELENSFRSPLTCLLVDIDHFKGINDNFGHPFGDAVLVEVAKILRNAVRGADAVGRLGGEEFIVILPHTPGNRALRVAQRIREAVESNLFLFENRAVPVTVSLGLVSYPSEHLKNKENMLKAVDEALYAAKKSGRNKIVEWTPS